MARREQHVSAVLQERVHRHHEEPRHGADQDQQEEHQRQVGNENERHDHETHRHAHNQDVERLSQRYEARREHRAERNADGGHALQDGCAVQAQPQLFCGPGEHDELQRRAHAPEQGRHAERNLSQLVFPQRGEADREVADQQRRIALLAFIAHAGVGDEQVENRGHNVKERDDEDGGFGRGLDAEVHERKIDRQQQMGHRRADERAPHHGAQYNRSDRQALDPAVRNNQLLRRQELGEDPVLRGGIGGRTEPDHGVGEQDHRVRRHAGQAHRVVEEHHDAAYELHRIGDEHHLALRNRIGEGADEGGEHHVGNGEKELEQRRHPGGAGELCEQADGRDQQCIVGERAEELRRHDGVEAALHAVVSRPGSRER